MELSWLPIVKDINNEGVISSSVALNKRLLFFF